MKDQLFGCNSAKDGVMHQIVNAHPLRDYLYT